MKKILLLISIFLLSVIKIKAMANPYSEYQTLTLGEDKQQVTLVNCGWYAWKMAKENADVELPAFGNAVNWYDNAKKAGYSVGTVAKPNSIVVYKTSSPFGHVAYVTRVDGYYMYINEAGIWYQDKIVSDDCTWGFNDLGEETCDYDIRLIYKPYNGNGIVNNNQVLSSGTRTEDEGSSKIIGFIYLSEPQVQQQVSINKVPVEKNDEEDTAVKEESITQEETVEKQEEQKEKEIVQQPEKNKEKVSKKKQNLVIPIICVMGIICLVFGIFLLKRKIKNR